MRLQRSTGILFAESAELRDPAVRMRLWREQGYRWIRRAIRPWAETLRNPVLGTVFELSQWEQPGTWHLMSPETDAVVLKLTA
jgi:hypothetical protein